MKTINNVQKTGIRNFKNSTMKTFVLLTSVVLFGFIFQAGAINKPMLSSAIDNLSLITAMGTVAPAAGIASEATLEVENWMTNENLFAPHAVSESEQPMQIENWMTDPENFMETTFTKENDQVLEVENWMLNKENFSSFNINEDTEKALEVQGWMLDEKTWGK